MQKTLYTLLLVAIIGVQAKAQGTFASFKRGFHPGTITKPGGEIIQGYVFNLNESDNQDKCLFWLDANDPKTRTEYKPATLSLTPSKTFSTKLLITAGTCLSAKLVRIFY